MFLYFSILGLLLFYAPFCFLFYSFTFLSNLISIIFFLLSSLLYKSLLLYSLTFSFLFYILFLLWFLLRLFYPKSVMRYSIFLKCKRYFPLYWHVNNIFTCCLFLYFCPCFRSLAISFIDCTQNFKIYCAFHMVLKSSLTEFSCSGNLWHIEYLI